jgi:hypothetical protein
MISPKNQNWIFIILVFLVLISITYFLNSEGNKCTVDPLPYGIKQIEKTSQVTMTCSCTAIKPNLFKTLEYNSSGLVIAR